MLRLLSDEDVHGAIVRGLWRHEPDLDLVRVQDVGLAHTPDPLILEWAATHGRVLITADVGTMVPHAWDRVRAGQPMPGLLALRENVGIGREIDDILLVATCYTEEEMAQEAVLYIPL
jgi:hypothetical protein